MKTETKKIKEKPENSAEAQKGPMMEFNPWTEKDKKEMAEWAAKHRQNAMTTKA